MKKIRNLLLFPLILLCFMAFAQVSLAQAPPPPPSAKGSSTNKAPGGGAPVDGGLYIALALVAGYGGWKLVKTLHKRRQAAGN
jgi:hypothetical protein